MTEENTINELPVKIHLSYLQLFLNFNQLFSWQANIVELCTDEYTY